MRTNRTFWCAMLLAFAGGLIPIAAQVQHITAFTGTWKYNASKSSFDPGPTIKNFTITFTPDGVRHLDLTGADGKPLQVSLPWSDGKEVTPTGMENARVVSKIQGRTVEDVWRQDGKIIETVHGVVSPDGKSLTMNVEGPLRQGGVFRNLVVFDKQ